MIDVGLTGGIASGKTTVSKKLKELGAIILDADEAAKNALAYGTPCWEKLKDWLGPDFFMQDGNLDRTKLANYIFTDAGARQKLNRIVHPFVKKSMEEKRGQLMQQHPRDIFIWDVPLLIETGMYKLVEKVILVTVPEKIQIKRLMIRDKLTYNEAKSRLDSQMKLEEKKKYADYIIDNSGLVADTYQKVEDFLWPELIQIEKKSMWHIK